MWSVQVLFAKVLFHIFWKAVWFARKVPVKKVEEKYSRAVALRLTLVGLVEKVPVMLLCGTFVLIVREPWLVRPV